MQLHDKISLNHFWGLETHFMTNFFSLTYLQLLHSKQFLHSNTLLVVQTSMVVGNPSLYELAQSGRGTSFWQPTKLFNKLLAMKTDVNDLV